MIAIIGNTIKIKGSKWQLFALIDNANVTKIDTVIEPNILNAASYFFFYNLVKSFSAY